MLQAQSKSKLSRQPSNQSYLEQAKKLRDEDPEKAIKFLEKAIRSSKRDSDYATDAEAYFLLGNIYEEIGQNDLALQRYIRADRLFELTDLKELRAENYYRTASIQLLNKQTQQAQNSFSLCLDYSQENDLRTRCTEGLAQVNFALGNFTEGYTYLDKIAESPTVDSATISRVEAKRSQGYIQQNDYSNARIAYDNSVSNLPQQKKTKKARKDLEIVEETKEQLLRMDTISPVEQIEVRQLNMLKLKEIAAPNSNYIAENLALADLYIRKNELDKAAEFIRESEISIEPSTDAARVAEVFKKSSELNNLRGDFQAALIDYQRFIQANDKAITVKEAELNRQIEIVKTQQNIDLFEKDYDLAEKDRSLMQSQLQTQKIIIGFLLLLLLGAGIFFYISWKNIRERRRANQMLLLKSLRTQMNPHFIFNSLNSVNSFIAKNDEKAANKFLAEFSGLMRKVLDYSQKDFITLAEEIELNELYLKLEHFRFRDKFDFEFIKDIQADGQETEVPPMLIQPFIENAVWHGLRYKKEKGKLTVKVLQHSDKLVVKITDNGIGRKNSKALKTQNQRKIKSTGLANVEQRISLINEIYRKNYKLEIQDFKPEQAEPGTAVTVQISI